LQKWILLVLATIILVPTLATAICCEKNKDCIISETCQDGSCGDCSIAVYEREGILRIPHTDMRNITLYTYIYNATTNLTDYGTYPYSINCTTAEVCQGDCFVELKQECEVQEMEGLTVMLFVMTITALFLVMPFILNFSKNEFANFVLKRCSLLLGMFLLSLNTGIVATIADNAGLNVLNELFRYLWLVNWSIYIFMMIFFWTTLQSALKLWRDIAMRKRMGEEEE